MALKNLNVFLHHRLLGHAPWDHLRRLSDEITICDMSRFVAQWLVITLALGSMLSAPPIMAWTMSSANQMTASQQSNVDAAHCSLCQQHSPDQQHQSANPMPDCSLVACGGIAAVGAPAVGGISFDTARLSASYFPHFGRLVPGPKPHPPRTFHSS